MRAQNSLTIQDQARFQRILKNLKLFKIFLKFFIPVNFLENRTKMIHYDELEFLKYEVDQVKDFIKTKSMIISIENNKTNKKIDQDLEHYIVNFRTNFFEQINRTKKIKTIPSFLKKYPADYVLLHSLKQLSNFIADIIYEEV